MLFLDLLFGGSPPALEALKHIETPRKAYYYAGPGRHYVCGAPLATFVFKGQFWLVVWNIFLFFHSVRNVIIPTDELTPSFFRGVG